MEPSDVLVGAALLPLAPTPSSVISFRMASAWKRPMLRPARTVPMSLLPNVRKTWRTSKPAVPSAVFLVVDVLPRFGLPPSLVLIPGYNPNVTPMSYPACVVAALMLSAAGSRPLLTDEDERCPSPEATHVSPPSTAFASAKAAQWE